MNNNDLYAKYGNHPLFGRRALHILSPVRWSSTKYMHDKDSNYQAYNRIVNWLPMMHHTVLVPETHSIIEKRPNVTLIEHPYLHSVLANRGFFDSKALLKELDFTKMDFDYIMCHQPEILYNVFNGLQTSRYGLTASKFIFFHWVECPKSRPTSEYPTGLFRQLEGIQLSNKAYFHCQRAFDYLKENWKEHQFIGEIIDDNVKDKLSWMPTSNYQWDDVEEEPFELPKKKILLFNHRWNKTTGVQKLVAFTENLNRDEYLVWLTDSDAKQPKAGEPAPKWMHCQYLTRGQYKFLLKNAYLGLSFVHDYMTWNLSVQDCISMGLPTLIHYQPIMEAVLGDNYELYFKKKEEFEALIKNGDNIRKTFNWILPNHDEIWKNNLINDMIKTLPVIQREPLNSREWLWHIRKGEIHHKKHLLYNTHRNLYLSNSWERIRQWCLANGCYDDPYSKYTKLHIIPGKEKEVDKLLEGVHFKESLKDPNFTVLEKKFW